MTAAPNTPIQFSASPAADLASCLPHALPDCENARLALFAIRRMGANGIADAYVAHSFVSAFGASFRRPLVLMRAFLADMATVAQSPIAIAPCCCTRTTHAEAVLLTVLARAEIAPDSAALLLSDLIGVRQIDRVLAGAEAVTAAFADAGRPISV